MSAAVTFSADKLLAAIAAFCELSTGTPNEWTIGRSRFRLDRTATHGGDHLCDVVRFLATRKDGARLTVCEATIMIGADGTITLMSGNDRPLRDLLGGKAWML